jgi:hypothetical protein
MRGPEVIITTGDAAYLPATGTSDSMSLLFARLGISSADNTATTVYVAEELLYCTTFELPAKTPNIRDAVHYQLGIQIPFPEGSYLHSYSTKKKGDTILVTIYALLKETIEPHLAEIIANGSTIDGLYPLSQRYLTRHNRKEKWALLLPGPIQKLLVFDNGKTGSRLLCPTEPTLATARELADCQAVYRQEPTPESGFLDPEPLLAEPALGAEFDLLPADFRRPDYFKMIITALVGINIIALLLLFGIKEYRFHTISKRVDAEIAKLQPQVKVIGRQSSSELDQQKIIERLESLGKNPDLIKLFSELSLKLPSSSYLDQIRMDKKSNAIFIHGYSDDISELTTNLQSLGEVRLKSTSRRKNKNYFQVEISLQ